MTKFKKKVMDNKIIYNACIVTMNEKMEIIKNGSIQIKEGKIKNICSKRLEDPSAEYIDACGMIVMPGFVNIHTHVPMTLLRGYADDLPLHTWLNEYIFPAEAKFITPKNVAVASRFAFIEMIKSGTTCFNDMYFFEDVIATEAQKAGIRAVVGESLIDFPTPSFKTLDEGIKHTELLLQKWDHHPTVHPTICSHSPYTCSKTTLQIAKKMADAYQIPFHIHVAETRKEVEDIQRQTSMTPAAYLHSIGILGQNVVAAHSVWLTPEDISLYAQTGTSVAHCPKSNLKLASGIANTDAYLKAGVNVGIGTDGSASNNNLDMVEEMRFAALLAKGSNHNPEAINARTALQMATINGAKALGLDHLIGSLEIGKQADLLLIHAEASNMQPIYDEYSAIVYAMNSKNIRSVMVDGEWSMYNRILCHIDKEETMTEMQRITTTM